MENSPMWERIKNYLKSPACESIHKIIWDNYAVITDHNGTRYKLTAETPMGDVYSLLQELRANGVGNKYTWSKYLMD